MVLAFDQFPAISRLREPLFLFSLLRFIEPFLFGLFMAVI